MPRKTSSSTIGAPNTVTTNDTHAHLPISSAEAASMYSCISGASSGTSIIAPCTA